MTPTGIFQLTSLFGASRRDAMLRTVLMPIFFFTILILFSSVKASVSDISELMPIEDTFVAQNRPDRTAGNATGLWIGRDIDGGFGVEKSFLRFGPLPNSPDVQLVSAKLSVKLGGITGSTEPLDIRAIWVKSAWSESELTWAKYEELDVDETVSSPLVSVPGTVGESFEFDVTDLARAWLSDQTPQGSFGLLLEAPNLPESQIERAFWSTNCDCEQNEVPTLVLTYVRLESHLESSHGGELDASEDIVYTVRLKNRSEFALTGLTVIATKPKGTRWPPEGSGGTIPEERTDGDTIVFDEGINLGPQEERELYYTVKFVMSDDPAIPVIIHEPVIISGMYSSQDSPAGHEYTFETNSTVNPVKIMEGKRVWMPIGLPPKIVATDTDLE